MSTRYRPPPPRVTICKRLPCRKVRLSWPASWPRAHLRRARTFDVAAGHLAHLPGGSLSLSQLSNCVNLTLRTLSGLFAGELASLPAGQPIGGWIFFKLYVFLTVSFLSALTQTVNRAWQPSVRLFFCLFACLLACLLLESTAVSRHGWPPMCTPCRNPSCRRLLLLFARERARAPNSANEAAISC